MAYNESDIRVSSSVWIKLPSLALAKRGYNCRMNVGPRFLECVTRILTKLLLQTQKDLRDVFTHSAQPPPDQG